MSAMLLITAAAAAPDLSGIRLTCSIHEVTTMFADGGLHLPSSKPDPTAVDVKTIKEKVVEFAFGKAEVRVLGERGHSEDHIGYSVISSHGGYTILTSSGFIEGDGINNDYSAVQQFYHNAGVTSSTGPCTIITGKDRLYRVAGILK